METHFCPVYFSVPYGEKDMDILEPRILPVPPSVQLE